MAKAGKDKSVSAVKCPECGSKHLVKFGYNWRARKRVQQYRCKDCGRITSRPKGG